MATHNLVSLHSSASWHHELTGFSINVYSSLQKFCYQNENSKLISDKITTIFNDFLHWSGRTYQILPKSINEHNFLLLCVMFSFTHTFKTLVNILKNTVLRFYKHVMIEWLKILQKALYKRETVTHLVSSLRKTGIQWSSFGKQNLKKSGF